MSKKWAGTITIPKVPETAHKVGGNFIRQHPLRDISTEAIIYDAKYPGYHLLITKLESPFNKILIRKKGAKKVEHAKACLYCIDEYDTSTLDIGTRFKWECFGNIYTIADTPEKVLDSWKGKFAFKQEDREEEIKGLRPPQLGALHAIAAHFATGTSHEAATVVLPTGTGKTEVMLATLAYKTLNKVLVIVPTSALRTQISNKFISMGLLPQIGVIPKESARPFVAVIKVGIKSKEESIEILRRANVIVATPQILNSSDELAVKELSAGCQNLFIDEAHHSTAKTWDQIRETFLEKRITQFTATPFRNDGKHIGGKIIFNYRLGDAQNAEYFTPIRLNTIEEYGEESEKDRKIAIAALDILKDDVETKKLDHLLLARVDNKTSAIRIHQLYSKLAPEYAPVLVYSGSGRKTKNEEELKKLTEQPRGSRIIVCVDMLGEGFDLPNLKIAAIHDKHKSLAITLQFVGRFTRSGDEVGEASVVINVADEKAEKRLQRLYSEGADWDSLIKRLSEEEIERKIKLQDLIEGLKNKGDLHEQISLWNLTPSLTTKIYKTNCEEWDPEKYQLAMPPNIEHWHSISEEKNVLVVLAMNESLVKWGGYQELTELSYQLLIAHWDKDKQALFVYSTDYDGMRVEKIASQITSESSELVSGDVIFNILNNVELPLAKNLGTSKIGAISFTSYFGPNVTEGLAAIEKAESELNNISCLGYEDGDRVLWGGSKKKGKIWQVKNGSIQDWLEWCDKTWEKVNNEESIEPNITKDFLRPQKLDAPYNVPVISAQWGEHLQSSFSNKVYVLFGKDEYYLFETDISIEKVTQGEGIEIKIFSDDKQSIYKLLIGEEYDGGYKYEHESGQPVSFKFGNGEPRSFQEHAIIDPFIIRYSDGTYSYNNYHIPIKIDAGTYPQEEIEIWEWNGIPLNQESMGKKQRKDTIQYKTYEYLKDAHDFIFNDDGTGEAADLVCIKDIDHETIGLTLVHCKNAKGGIASGDIDNLYTVCGQAQKSISVKHRGLLNLSKDLIRREALWQKTSHSRLLKGDFKKLTYFTEKARKSKIKFEVMIVQPGLKKSAASQDMLRLIATTELYLKKTTEAEFRIIGSE